MTGFQRNYQAFTWRGEPIYDIHKWAKDRGERMVEYRLTTRTVYGDEVEEGIMPESFWNNLMRTGNQHYEEISR